VFGWERHIPFLDWTILPYWSINLFYGASLFVCTTPAELDRHGRRLLTAQVIAVACFLVVPLRFTFERPEAGGVARFLFDALTSFDRPFNQAPSLHIALLVILWDLYARHLPGRWHPALHAWFALIGLSVLTTYQHHFVDVPTGAALGFLCLWAWPAEGEPPLPAPLAEDPRRLRLAARYAAGALAAAGLGAALGGAWLWLLWPALSLALVAANYAFCGAGGFQKDAGGRMSPAARWLLAPYLAAAWINSRLWTWRDPGSVPVADGVSLGRIPSARDRARLAGATLVDLCAELPSPRDAARVRAIPMLDLVPPPPERLRDAADAIERARRQGPVLVCCALGFSRSAAAVATWLVVTGRAATAEDAVARLRAARPRIVLDGAALAAIGSAAAAPR
jgi:hypothetical protein